MTLEVSFTEYAETVARMLPGTDVYVAKHAHGALITAADAKQHLVVACVHTASAETTQKALEKAGLTCRSGSWFDPESPAMSHAHAEVYVGAVAYKTGEATPGIWVDAYASLPTQMMVLRQMFDEFVATGELGEATFEEFTKHADPSVVILAPSELSRFIEGKAVG